MEPFVLEESTGLFWIDSWRRKYPEVKIGFTSRQLSVEDPYGNLAYHVEDAPEHVLANRTLLSDKLQLPVTVMTCANQTHGKNVVVVDEWNRGLGVYDMESAIPDTDGLITKLPNTLLALFYADCVPLFFYDPVERVIGLAHAGWRGTVQNIALEMVQKLQDKFHSKIDNIVTAIGPSIGKCCYQVDEYVMGYVRDLLKNDADLVATPDGDEHYFLDLKKINQILLERAGILSSHIEVSDLCTSCNHNWFFSHRKENGRTGRMSAFAVLKGGEA